MYLQSFPDVVVAARSCNGRFLGVRQEFLKYLRPRRTAARDSHGGGTGTRVRERGPKDIRARALNRYVTRNAAWGLCVYTHAFNNACVYIYVYKYNSVQRVCAVRTPRPPATVFTYIITRPPPPPPHTPFVRISYTYTI